MAQIGFGLISLTDRTNGRTFATVLCPSVCRL